MSMTPKKARAPASNDEGMTIAEHARIQFAAAALQGLLINNLDRKYSLAKLSAAAFEYAENMLKAGGYTE